MTRPIRFVGGLLALAAIVVLEGCSYLRASSGDTLALAQATEPTQPEIVAADIATHVAALTAPIMEGRMSGSAGERVAAEYLKRAMERLELEPAGDDGDFLHRFTFTSGVALGANNTLSIAPSGDASDPESVALEIQRDWRPLAFSRSDRFTKSQIVFAGYGIVAPASGDSQSINEYAQIEAQDRWVLVFRGMPSEIEGDRRQHMQRHVSLRHKAMVARDHGARGILFMSGPLGQFREQLVPLRFDASLAGTRIGALALTDSAASKILAAGQDEGEGEGPDSGTPALESIQAETNRQLLALLKGQRISPDASTRSTAISAAKGVTIEGRIDLETIRATGHNVVGRLQIGPEPSAQTIVLGAHFDHLGFGETTGSLASGSDVGRMHPGADDNASGVAVLLEVAEALRAARDAFDTGDTGDVGDEDGAIGSRDFIFAAWSGEELGLLGSDAWARENINPHSNDSGPVAYLNFDMVGRLRNELIVQGLGSSPAWQALLDSAAEKSPLAIARQQDAYLPTDVTSFYTQGVPVLAAFTGVHSEYHTPGDLPELLNLEGTAQIAQLFMGIASEISRGESPPPYQAQQRPASGQTRAGFRVFLGTVPDYAQTDLVGVRLSGVAPDGPAESAGIQSGDLIIKVDERTIENLYDYTYALQALRVGESARIVVERAGDPLSFEVVPISRD